MNNIFKIRDIFYNNDNIEDFLKELNKKFKGKDVFVMAQYEKDQWEEEPDFGGTIFDKVKWKDNNISYEDVKKGDRGYANQRPPFIIVLNDMINLGLDDGFRFGKRIITPNDPYGEEDWNNMNEKIKLKKFNNIKNFNIFANENNDHKDIDPYGEENWTGENFDMENFEANLLNTETIFDVGVNIGGETLEYNVYHSEDYGWEIKLKYSLDYTPELNDFLEEHNDEIREILIRTCRQE